MRIDLEVEDMASVQAIPHRGGIVIWIKDSDSVQDLDMADTVLNAFLEEAADRLMENINGTR